MSEHRVYYEYTIPTVNCDMYLIDEDEFEDWADKPYTDASHQDLLEYMRSDRDWDTERESLYVTAVD